MRISYWSSDVCSSDLVVGPFFIVLRSGHGIRLVVLRFAPALRVVRSLFFRLVHLVHSCIQAGDAPPPRTSSSQASAASIIDSHIAESPARAISSSGSRNVFRTATASSILSRHAASTSSPADELEPCALMLASSPASTRATRSRVFVLATSTMVILAARCNGCSGPTADPRLRSVVFALRAHHEDQDRKSTRLNSSH